MALIIDELKALKNRLAEFEKELSNDKFGKWLSVQCVRRDMNEFYEDLITDLMTELEGLQVETIDRDTPEQRKYVHYSEDFINRTVHKIDSEINRITWIVADSCVMIGEPNPVGWVEARNPTYKAEKRSQSRRDIRE